MDIPGSVRVLDLESVVTSVRDALERERTSHRRFEILDPKEHINQTNSSLMPFLNLMCFLYFLKIFAGAYYYRPIHQSVAE